MCMLVLGVTTREEHIAKKLYNLLNQISHATSTLFGSVSAVILFQEVHMVVYLLADVKRHWFMSAEVSSWGFKVRKLKI